MRFYCFLLLWWVAGCKRGRGLFLKKTPPHAHYPLIPRKNFDLACLGLVWSNGELDLGLDFFERLCAKCLTNMFRGVIMDVKYGRLIIFHKDAACLNYRVWHSFLCYLMFKIVDKGETLRYNCYGNTLNMLHPFGGVRFSTAVLSFSF